MDYMPIVRLHSVWMGMIARCQNPTSPSYPNYGARGITVCSAWQDFNRFCHWALTHGYAQGLQLDRRDNDQGYRPLNCRWVTKQVNGRNKRTNRWLVAWGDRRTIAAWAEDSRCQVTARCLAQRTLAGWSPEEAMSIPSTRGNPKCMYGHDKDGQRTCPTCHRERERERHQKGAYK